MLKKCIWFTLWNILYYAIGQGMIYINYCLSFEGPIENISIHLYIIFITFIVEGILLGMIMSQNIKGKIDVFCEMVCLGIPAIVILIYHKAIGNMNNIYAINFLKLSALVLGIILYRMHRYYKLHKNLV